MVARRDDSGAAGDERIPVRLHAARYVIAVATFACAWVLAPPLAAVLISMLVIVGVLLDVQRFPASPGGERARLEALWATTDEAIAFLDPDARVNDATAAFARFFGREPASVTGLALSELAPESELGRLVSEGARGGRDVAQLALRNGSGERVPVDVVVRPSGGGTSLLALRPTVPVSAEPKHGEATPEAAALVAIIERAAHDLNNILSAISGNLDLARQDVGPVHPARESLDEILSATRRARAVASTLIQSTPRRSRSMPAGAPAAATAASAATSPPAAPAGDAGKLLLYVDDDEPLTDIIGRLLTRKGHRVAGHTDVTRALADFKSRAGEFSLVVTDLNLPNASGLDVAREVRALRPDVPVVLVSGFFREEELQAARAEGIAETLLKASSAHEFAADIARYLTR
jgi:CheY-like chemotaxis protein/PAS domain-containing protein